MNHNAHFHPRKIILLMLLIFKINCVGEVTVTNWPIEIAIGSPSAEAEPTDTEVTVELSVTSGAEWGAYSSESWCTPPDGGLGTGTPQTVSIALTENTGPLRLARTCEVVFTIGELSESFTISQKKEEEPCFSGGAGTVAAPYQICDYEDLKLMGNDLSLHYVLAADIDASPSRSEGASGCIPYYDMNPGAADCTGWQPIGDSGTNFTGGLNGDGHVIKNLYVNVNNDGGDAYAGLFGYTDTAADIRNVGLEAVGIIASSVSAEAYAGGIAGRNDGTIINSYASGRIFGIAGTVSYIGGLVGSNEGGTISNSYAAGEVVGRTDVLGSNAYAGGLAGYNNGASAEIRNSYASASASASSRGDSYAGGLVGSNDSNTEVSDSYALGDAFSFSDNSNSYAGGLAGDNNNGTISNSYTTGSAGCVIGRTCSTPIFGGLAGANSGMINNTNYFVDGGGDGVGIGMMCGASVCIEQTLDEIRMLTMAMVTDWSTGDMGNWNFGTASELPRLQYADEPAGSCGGDTGITCGDVISGQCDMPGETPVRHIMPVNMCP